MNIFPPVYNVKQYKYILANNYDGNPNLPEKKQENVAFRDYVKYLIKLLTFKLYEICMKK